MKTNEQNQPYVIVRSREQGVMCGYLVEYEGREVRLANARQIWRYSSRFVLPDLAEFGLTTKFQSKLSCAMSEPMIMLESCGILHCTEVGAKSLIEWPAENHE